MVSLVHDNAKVPSIDLKSIYLVPGRYHKLGYAKKESTLLPSPYSTCTDKVSLGLSIMYDQFNGTDYDYSRFECFAVCAQAFA